MKIEIIVSTMNLKDAMSLVKRMNIKTDTIIVNQCNVESYEEFNFENSRIRVFSYNEKGLSKSRNRGLENVAKDTDIICITDDDVIFEDEYPKIIENGYAKNKDADVISFNVKRSNGTLNKKIPQKVGYISIFRICSVSITFNAHKVRNTNVKFDENFGAGTELYMGEENIFLTDLLRKKLKIYSEKEVFCRLEDIRESTWFEGVNKKFLYVRGCVLKRIFKYSYNIFILEFAIRKFKLYKENISFALALKIMKQGARNFEKGNYSYER